MGNSLVPNIVVFPESLLLTRAMAALKLSAPNRQMVLSSLASRIEEGSSKSLQEATVGIFGFNAEGSENEIPMTNPEDGWPDYSENDELESPPSSDIWVSDGGKPQRNRPGTNAIAAIGAVRNFNAPNGFKTDGENGRPGKRKFPTKADRCVRCGAADHRWGNHRPFSISWLSTNPMGRRRNLQMVRKATCRASAF